MARRSVVEFSNTAIWEVPLRMTPVQFLQELEKHIRKTQGMSGTGSLLDVVQLAETPGKADWKVE
ncbi:hypothetical protein PVL29_000697 [Vitis rotundifolia]|uniref:Uncharacterized protein n=1 Tax=Vitis rotundifolia TaxID=103349 RepID=A0AA39E7Q6_VITRO|nr:hypothetical protein PVL29_000697 [Vitis rotundifolia]